MGNMHANQVQMFTTSTKTESEYEVNGTMTSCFCTFSRTMLLPCKHVFFAQIQASHESVTVFSEALVASRWRKDCQVFSVPPESALSFSSKPVTVLKKPKTNAVMNQSKIFNKVVILCRDIANAVAEHGQAVFNG